LSISIRKFVIITISLSKTGKNKIIGTYITNIVKDLLSVFRIFIVAASDQGFDHFYIGIILSSAIIYNLEAGDANFGNNTMAAVPLKENPSNGDGHWSAYVMSTDATDTNIVSVRVNTFYFLNKYI